VLLRQKVDVAIARNETPQKLAELKWECAEVGSC
jgi:hypothetical protein